MRTTAPHLWQRYPHTTRVLAVAVLAVLTMLVGMLLYENDYDPWAIVGVVIAFAAIGGRILDPPARKR